MDTKTLHGSWIRELGATSRGMMFLAGSFATPDALRTADALPRQRDRPQEAGAARGLLGAVLAATLMVAPAVGALVAGDFKPGDSSPDHTVELPTVTVRASPVDAEKYGDSRRIVELDAVVVHPREADRALHVATLEASAAPLASLDAQR